MAITIRPSGDVVAHDVPYDDFLIRFEGQRVEWINGEVIAMSPVSSSHSNLSAFLITVLKLLVPPDGQVHHAPMVMRVHLELPARAPDIAVILPENISIVRDYDITGPTDRVIEIVSTESHRRDRIEKFSEYEQGGVKEYWILDPVRQEALFYHLDANGLHVPAPSKELYQSRVLPKLRIDPAIFWREPLLIEGMDS